jgi:hypothetical protein
MNFSPTGTDPTFGITVEPGATLIADLQWAEPWYGVESDLNAYLLNAAGNLIVKETVKNAGTGSVLRQPVELLGWENPSTTKSAEVQLVIGRCISTCNTGANAATRPRLKVTLMENGSGVSKTEYLQSSETNGITVGPTIYGHAGSAAAITLAAVNYSQSATAPVEPERYSSRGPVTHYFGPVNGTTPAAKLSAAEVIQKPNVTATDCASTTFFATLSAGSWHFCGTSEAAPHAAAVAALMRQTQPLATPASILAKLESSATAFKTPHPAAVGAGLVNAEAAIAAIGGSPVSDPASTPVGPVEVTSAPATETRTTTTTPTESGTTTTTKPGSKSSSSTGTKAKPKVRIAAHPKALERTRKSSVVGRFRFSSNQNGVTFYCQVDGTRQRICGARLQRRFGIGRHVVRVRAVDPSDNSSSAASVFRFRVQRMGR